MRSELSRLYADEQMLRMKTNAASVCAPPQARYLLEQQEEELAFILPQLAHHLLQRRARIPKTIRAIVAWARLEDMEGDIGSLLEDHEMLIGFLNEGILGSDPHLEQLLRSMLQMHIEMACTLRMLQRDAAQELYLDT